ncbi:MAG: hypothetical protein Ct9H300mP28_26960 [Pseudomonadota bacterium]|nr:MAG: hypothetical protein Ct9H300mP28_26960 [Pseudomonadota bacterium]
MNFPTAGNFAACFKKWERESLGLRPVVSEDVMTLNSRDRLEIA